MYASTRDPTHTQGVADGSPSRLQAQLHTQRCQGYPRTTCVLWITVRGTHSHGQVLLTHAVLALRALRPTTLLAFQHSHGPAHGHAHVHACLTDALAQLLMAEYKTLACKQARL